MRGAIVSGTGLTLRGRLGDQSLQFPLNDGVHIIGRATTCDVHLDEASVSRLHARLHIMGPAARIEDLGSSNGTRLNGIELKFPMDLGHGDRIDLGNISLQVDNGVASATDLFLDQTQVREGLAVSLDEARRTRLGDKGKKAHLFRILAEAGELLTNPKGPDEMFEPLVALVEKALNPERVFLLLQDEGEDEPHIAASKTRSGGDDRGMILSQTLIKRVIEQRTAFLTEDASTDARLMGGDSIVSSGTHSAMAAPLFDNETVIGLLYADTSDLTVRYDRDELSAFILLANVVAVAITHARYHALEEERQRLATELDAARTIMSRLLPRTLPEAPGLALSAYLDPCEEVAGDLYDARMLDNERLLLVFGDVSGKGLPAALIVAGLLPTIRVVAQECRDLGRLTTLVNQQLYEATEAVRFSTLFIGVLDLAFGRFDYVNAGHNPPLVLDSMGELSMLNPSGPPVGMVPEFDYTVDTLALKPGSRMVFYSDGLTEAMDKDEDMYGDDRLNDLVAGCATITLEELQKRVLDDVAEFTGGAPQSDDMTMLLVGMGGPSQ